MTNYPWLWPQDSIQASLNKQKRLLGQLPLQDFCISKQLLLVWRRIGSKGKTVLTLPSFWQYNRSDNTFSTKFQSTHLTQEALKAISCLEEVSYQCRDSPTKHRCTVINVEPLA